jgi:hypothetical protein
MFGGASASCQSVFGNLPVTLHIHIRRIRPIGGVGKQAEAVAPAKPTPCRVVCKRRRYALQWITGQHNVLRVLQLVLQFDP